MNLLIVGSNRELEDKFNQIFKSIEPNTATVMTFEIYGFRYAVSIEEISDMWVVKLESHILLAEIVSFGVRVVTINFTNLEMDIIQSIRKAYDKNLRS